MPLKACKYNSYVSRDVSAHETSQQCADVHTEEFLLIALHTAGHLNGVDSVAGVCTLHRVEGCAFSDKPAAISMEQSQV